MSSRSGLPLSCKTDAELLSSKGLLTYGMRGANLWPIIDLMLLNKDNNVVIKY